MGNGQAAMSALSGRYPEAFDKLRPNGIVLFSVRGELSRAVGKCTGGAEQNYTTERHSLSVKISWSV